MPPSGLHAAPADSDAAPADFEPVMKKRDCTVYTGSQEAAERREPFSPDTAVELTLREHQPLFPGACRSRRLQQPAIVSFIKDNPRVPRRIERHQLFQHVDFGVTRFVPIRRLPSEDRGYGLSFRDSFRAIAATIIKTRQRRDFHGIGTIAKQRG